MFPGNAAGVANPGMRWRGLKRKARASGVETQPLFSQAMQCSTSCFINLKYPQTQET